VIGWTPTVTLAAAGHTDKAKFDPTSKSTELDGPMTTSVDILD